MRRLVLVGAVALLAGSAAQTGAKAPLNWGPGPPSLPAGAKLAVVSGNPAQPLKPLKDRKFIQIDRDNFNEVMADRDLTLVKDLTGRFPDRTRFRIARRAPAAGAACAA